MNKATGRAKLVYVDGRPVDEPRNRMGVSGAVRRFTDWAVGGGGTSTAIGCDVIQFCYYKRIENMQHFE